MIWKTIGPSYNFVRHDITNKFIKLLKLENNIDESNLIINIINKYIPISNSNIIYGTWDYYKENGVTTEIKQRILYEILKLVTTNKILQIVKISRSSV
jgi:hypothetical protein